MKPFVAGNQEGKQSLSLLGAAPSGYGSFVVPLGSDGPVSRLAGAGCTRGDADLCRQECASFGVCTPTRFQSSSSSVLAWGGSLRKGWSEAET